MGKKLPLHMKHALLGIKPILLGADTADQVKKVAGGIRASQGQAELERILQGEWGGFVVKETKRRSSSVEPNRSQDQQHEFKVLTVMRGEK